MSEPRYFATCRLFTGRYVAVGYIYDRMTGKVVQTCPHVHRPGRATTSTSRAQKCAERMLRHFVGAQAAREEKDE